MKTPVVILNFKTYLEASGEKALDLAKALESAADESGIQMIAAPQACDIYRIKEETSIPILSQHIDAISPGSHTGSTLFEALIDNGIDGSLLNHSEKRLTLADIQSINQKLKDNNLISCICTNNVETSVAAACFNPDIVAIEPPQLIGTGISVSQAEPEVVKGTVDKVKSINKDVKVLCGAGISTGEDMRSAIDLGAEGVLLASGIVKAEDPRNALLDLVSKL
ncbi:triose-phosphate isomerase [Methanobrevibacter sp. 87.7]|uniref:triose-phosphate isomerase n=1 Tax=Methanobrevibacter sp. 87.7 TaxID=387957 RepID=UPI000B508D8F|nr:triose-phosphate isomerase [Methanobrevibacter sp. 87.7]OWT33891.1 triose-phosphate isomerase [Methanobrevibacter sp. 87.7]